MTSTAMPTDKARLVTYVDHDLKAFLDEWAEEEDRSISNLLERMIKDCVKRKKDERNQQDRPT